MSRRNYIEKKNKQNQPDKQMEMLLEDAKAKEEKKRKKKREEEMMKWKNRRRQTRIEKHMTKLAEKSLSLTFCIVFSSEQAQDDFADDQNPLFLRYFYKYLGLAWECAFFATRKSPFTKAKSLSEALLK